MTAQRIALADVARVAAERDAGRVDVFWYRNDVALLDADVLDAEERARHVRLLTPLLRERFRNAHNTLRAVLAAYAGCAPADVAFVRGPHAKPALREGSVHFNLAHSHELVALAVAADAIGVDCQQVEERVDFSSMIATVAHADERVETRDEFFRAWTRKEAVMKQSGLGFLLAPARVRVGTAVSATGAWQRALVDGADGPYVRDLDAPSGFVAALAAAQPREVRELTLADALARPDR